MRTGSEDQEQEGQCLFFCFPMMTASQTIETVSSSWRWNSWSCWWILFQDDFCNHVLSNRQHWAKDGINRETWPEHPIGGLSSRVVWGQLDFWHGGSASCTSTLAISLAAVWPFLTHCLGLLVVIMIYFLWQSIHKHPLTQRYGTHLAERNVQDL